MMCVGQVARKVIELCRANRTDRCGGGTSICRAAGMFRMARWCLESRKSCRKRYMEEWPCGEREELVVGIDKEFGEVVPPTFGVQFLFLSGAR